VLQIERILAKLARDRGLLEQLRQQGMRYARECLSWDRKAQIMTEILSWTVGQGPKPDLLPPQLLRPQKPTSLTRVSLMAHAWDPKKFHSIYAEFIFSKAF
jgi:hypothetical protein